VHDIERVIGTAAICRFHIRTLYSVTPQPIPFRGCVNVETQGAAGGCVDGCTRRLRIVVACMLVVVEYGHVVEYLRILSYVR
jgi:hypothetical protein